MPYRLSMMSATQRQFDIFAQLVAYGDVHRCAIGLSLSTDTILDELAALEDRLGYTLFTQDRGLVSLTPAGRKAIAAMETLSHEAPEIWTEATDAGPQAEPDEASNSALALPPAASLFGARDEEREAAAPDVAAGDPIDHVSLPASPDAVTPKHFRPLPSARGKSPDLIVQNIVLAAHPAIFAHFQDTLTAFEDSSLDVDITLRLEGLDEADIPALFARGEADIAYFYALGEPADFASRYAWSERISLYIAADHPLAAQDTVLADELAEVPLVALAPDNRIRHLAEAALARAGLTVRDATFESDNLYEVMKAVRGGKGYFAAFGSVARDFGKTEGITRLAYAQGLPQVEVRQAVRPDMADNPEVSALAEFLFR
ncbi:LysR substrate-binding domain-containing protein [Sphingobium subterraneum]|uniref:DNA-binding transcriptional LysR family regulator n=1 Tax=Sphingobium subterraneum TaxID=627688 RepID=A0A841J5Y6_9SPHN|nr:LysR substrate-binding domain-containing protein [Sphingobium subterraneum]MBB6123631.1 DNA-binding transcriptional LysR family regulator [Sphingobium subterraneum]